ncbi:RNA-guided pseudouridylation complex pseudouridine synthase subunit Cbf5 [Candidatus Woesearchaeota archaeon]|nr:RNA-guided pseudouridylation complex pseudouridine synthase subunit Cbf5 [Candidatus Woesearchaeota archaeon]
MKLPFEEVKREVLVRKKSETSDKFGKDPEKRTVEELIDYGVVNIDKPQGPTSHQISAFVQKILKIKKSGHSGTLDPNVTGVLPVALDRATRIVQTLLPAGKEYVTIMHFHNDIPEKRITKVFDAFIGRIKQLPPIKSSVKRRERERTIYYIDVMEIDGRDILFRVGCEAGTYIRKLCHDIGKSIDSGAHMAELRRTKAGPFNQDSLVTLHELSDAFHYWKKGDEKLIRGCIKPVEYAVHHLSKIWVMDSAVDSLSHGRDLGVPGISELESGIEKDDKVAVMTLKNELVCLATAKMNSKKMAEEEKGIAARTDKVFIKTGIYPRIKK